MTRNIVHAIFKTLYESSLLQMLINLICSTKFHYDPYDAYRFALFQQILTRTGVNRTNLAIRIQFLVLILKYVKDILLHHTQLYQK